MNLDHRIRTVLAQLEVRLHFGSITAYNSSGSGGKAEGGDCPPGEAKPPHDLFRAEYIACDSDHCRVGVCERAERALQDALKVKTGDVPGETWDQLAARIVEDGLGEPVEVVARALRVTPTQVRKAREQLKRRVDDGRPSQAIGELSRKGKSVREISNLTGLPVTTVQRRIHDERMKRAA